MTTAQLLSTIQKVDLREAWPNETWEFTRWLAGNITALSDVLGLFDLELQHTEPTVGGYSLNILARDIDGNQRVVIENQLEPTDHAHLGKLLTYAARFNANMVVWLTREFRYEHRQALDWLNRCTDEETRFFGVVVELWKIDDSRPAPHFNVVAAPNDWYKSLGSISTNETLPSETIRPFRHKLDNKLRENSITPWRTRNSPVDLHVLESPFPYVRYVAFWNHGELGVAVSIDRRGVEGRDWNQWLFQKLEQHQTSIEAEIIEPESGESFVWELGGYRRESRIGIYRTGSIYDEPDSWDEFQDWIIRKFFKFKRVFDPHLVQLVR